MPSFSDILSKTAESIERPPLPPKGTYVLAVVGMPKTQTRKEYEVLDFSLQGVRAMEDVDVDELRAYAPNGKLDSIIVRKSFLFDTTDQAKFSQTEFNLRQFLCGHLGLDEHLTVKELLALAPRKQCLGVIDYRPNPENPEVIYTDLKRTAPIE